MRRWEMQHAGRCANGFRRRATWPPWPGIRTFRRRPATGRDGAADCRAIPEAATQAAGASPGYRATPHIGAPCMGDTARMPASDFPEPLRQRLDEGLDALGLDRALAVPLLDYLALLLRWNRTYNLTAIRDPDEMVTR